MWHSLRLFPPQASTFASREDALFLFLVAVSAFFVALIFLQVLIFAIRYRRRSPEEKARRTRDSLALEIVWTVIPLGLTVIMFAWGAQLFYFASRPPANAIQIDVVGKQWMWKFQHPEGPREIDELHVPVGTPVKLLMTSEDVIHSLFVPAFRVKKDVLPGRYVTVWFEATRAGDYHLFCAQFCGTSHAGMIGHVVAMDPVDYERWLRGGVSGVSPAVAGEMLFQRLNCGSCHKPDNTGLGPSLVGVFGQPVTLAGGQTLAADESYLRESILAPQAKVVAGYGPIMPTFKGLVSEEQLLQLIAYLKSLKPGEGQQAKQ